MAHALYKGTRYAVSHPRQVLALGLAAHIIPIAAQTGNEFLINQITTNYQVLSVSCGFNQWQCVCGLGWQSSWHTMISMGGSSYLMEQPLGVSLVLIKTQPMISSTRQLQV